MNVKKHLAISAVIPVRNVEKNLMRALEALKNQDYPIKEMIIIDNHSDDHSVAIAKKFKKTNKELNIKIIKRKKPQGLSASYNLGAKIAQGDYLLTYHSDCLLPTKRELRKLTQPFLKDPSVIVCRPLLLHPRKLWLTYNFWQKCSFAHFVDKKIKSGNGKFDCYQKEAFLKFGGYDEENFAFNSGAEDADLCIRLQKKGKGVLTQALVIHNHAADPDYSFKDWLFRRRFLTMIYGRHLQRHLKDIKMEALYFLVKPLLCFSSLLCLFSPLFLLPVALSPFIYLSRMFTEASTRQDSRILLLPFILIFLIYAETYWLFKSFFLKKPALSR